MEIEHIGVEWFHAIDVTATTQPAVKHVLECMTKIAQVFLLLFLILALLFFLLFILLLLLLLIPVLILLIPHNRWYADDRTCCLTCGIVASQNILMKPWCDTLQLYCIVLYCIVLYCRMWIWEYGTVVWHTQDIWMLWWEYTGLLLWDV